MSGPLSKRIALDTGLDYHYLEWPADCDEASAHTLILIHGFLDFCSSWRAVVDAGLVGKFRILAPDMRGHGDSARVGTGGYYHFFDYAADLRSFVQQLSTERLSLVGHSMGGAVVSYYAGSFPEHIHKVVLMEGLGPSEQELLLPQKMRKWIRGWSRARTHAPHRYSSIAAAAEKLCARDPLLTEAMALRLAEWGTRKEGNTRVFKHDPLHLSVGPLPYRVESAQQFYAQISCPVLVIDGDQSEMRHSPQEQQRRISSFPDVREAVLSGAGHMMQRHQPKQLAEMLADFL